MAKGINIDKHTAKNLSNSRIEEAVVLLKEKFFSGAYYLAGYSVECALKSVICSSFKSETIPSKEFVNDIYTHDLEKLMKASGLYVKFQLDLKNNLDLSVYWSIVSKWTESSRYEIKTEQEAQSLIDAINNPQNGILTWISKH